MAQGERQYAHSPSSPVAPSKSKRAKGVYFVLAIVAVVLVALLVISISLSDGTDYVHAFGKACLVDHHGWHFHMHCGSVKPPTSG